MEQFDDIRPFNDSEVPAAIQSLLKEEYFRRAMMHITTDPDRFFSDLSEVKTSDEFQKSMLFPFTQGLVGCSSCGLNGIGFENIDPRKSYTYISNHRDILLDVTFLGFLLSRHGIPTPEMALGDNLLVYPWMRDLVRVNKGIIVYRNMPLMKTHEEAHRLSGYINYTLKEKGHSVWIAQREGRAKDSDDRTQESVIKMLSFEGGKDMKSNVMALNIVPVSISYEYDPCDYLKAREFQLKRDNPDYKKEPKDDLTSMSTGLLGKKGGICFTIAKPINPEVEKIPCNFSRAEFFSAVAVIMDKAIHGGYHIYPGNYVACDELSGMHRFADKYTAQDKEKFDAYIKGQLDKITDLPNPDHCFLRTKMLEMYVNPLINKMKAVNEVNGKK